MTTTNFLIQNVDTFSYLEGDVPKARFTPTDGNIADYPENYCRVDILNGTVYVLNNGLDTIHFDAYLGGSPPIMEVQFGPMPEGPLYYYLSLPGSFNAGLDTFTISGEFNILNQSDYLEVYETPNSSTFIFNGRAFNQY